MIRTIGDIRQYVWGYLDLTIEDIPTTLIDTWIADGDRRCARRLRSMDHFEVETTFVSTAGVSTYALPLVTVGTAQAKIKEVSEIVGPHGTLTQMSVSEAQERYFTISDVQREPVAYSLFADKVRLWEKPNGAYTFTVRGFRARTDWMKGGVGAAPDLPEDFHELVQEWVMVKAHEHQDDPERAGAAKAAFSEGLNELIADEQAAGPGPVILNSGRGRSNMDSRLAFPWE